jgi:hypothetical protein
MSCKINECNCTWVDENGKPCPRKGRCCECIKHHREAENTELPACYFRPFMEKTYNRTIDTWIQEYR